MDVFKIAQLQKFVANDGGALILDFKFLTASVIPGIRGYLRIRDIPSLCYTGIPSAVPASEIYRVLPDCPGYRYATRDVTLSSYKRWGLLIIKAGHYTSIVNSSLPAQLTKSTHATTRQLASYRII